MAKKSGLTERRRQQIRRSVLREVVERLQEELREAHFDTAIGMCCESYAFWQQIESVEEYREGREALKDLLAHVKKFGK